MDARMWDERYRSAELVWGAEPNRFVREQCEGMTPGVALDVACGEGRNALWLARLGWQVRAVDFSSVAIERARELTSKEEADVAQRIAWQVADVTADVLEARSADLVLIAYLHLVPSAQEQAVEAAARATRAGGTLLVIGHDKRNLTEGVGGPDDIDRLHDPAALAEQLRAHGLTVEIAETVERPTHQGVALDSLVRASR